jgi:hypothetical protein
MVHDECHHIQQAKLCDRHGESSLRGFFGKANSSVSSSSSIKSDFHTLHCKKRGKVNKCMIEETVQRSSKFNPLNTKMCLIHNLRGGRHVHMKTSYCL